MSTITYRILHDGKTFWSLLGPWRWEISDGWSTSIGYAHTKRSADRQIRRQIRRIQRQRVVQSILDNTEWTEVHS